MGLFAVPQPNYGRLVNALTVGGVVQRNVWYLHNPAGDATDAHWAFMAEFVQLWWRGDIDPFNSPNQFLGREVTFLETELRWIGITLSANVLRLPLAFAPFIPPDATPCVPPNATLSLEWTTGRAGRHFRGRSYLLGLANGLVRPDAPTRITSDTGRAIESVYRGLVDFVYFAGTYPGQFVFCVYHRDGLEPPGGVGPRIFGTPVTGCRLADTLLDSQKGRLPGHVRH